MNESLWRTAGEELACLTLAIWVRVRRWRLQAGVRVQPGPPGLLQRVLLSAGKASAGLALVAQTADPRAP